MKKYKGIFITPTFKPTISSHNTRQRKDSLTCALVNNNGV